MAVKTISVYKCDRCGKDNLTARDVFTDSTAVISVDGKVVLLQGKVGKKHYCEACAREIHDMPPTGNAEPSAPQLDADGNPVVKKKRGRKPKSGAASEPVPATNTGAATEDDSEDDETGTNDAGENTDNTVSGEPATATASASANSAHRVRKTHATASNASGETEADDEDAGE